jgi:polyhydroxyalkanoate synthesis repressor PhaR
MTVVKKYSNRRLYDTGDSRYITLEELADKIRAGRDVRVVDAKTDEDLTQVTLAQIILESRGAARLLPVPLLTQLIRMNDDALAEFLGRFLSSALELYVQARQGAQSVAPYNPFAALPFMAQSALARWFTASPWTMRAAEAQAPYGASPPPASEVADLRRELEELKAELRKKRK